mmetsp:Transcript_79042/g.183371  ORF Transcript_79042/g.183371 Transcript_79042/m.183371 type:complete len:207 (+) Transcript_79042:1471-2091(+)
MQVTWATAKYMPPFRQALAPAPAHRRASLRAEQVPRLRSSHRHLWPWRHCLQWRQRHPRSDHEPSNLGRTSQARSRLSHRGIRKKLELSVSNKVPRCGSRPLTKVGNGRMPGCYNHVRPLARKAFPQKRHRQLGSHEQCFNEPSTQHTVSSMPRDRHRDSHFAWVTLCMSTIVRQAVGPTARDWSGGHRKRPLLKACKSSTTARRK